MSDSEVDELAAAYLCPDPVKRAARIAALEARTAAAQADLARRIEAARAEAAAWAAVVERFEGTLNARPRDVQHRRGLGLRGCLN